MFGIVMISMVVIIIVGFLVVRVVVSVGRNLRSGVFRKVMLFLNIEMNEFFIVLLIICSINDI